MADNGESERARKLFLGGLNYDTDEDGLKGFFGQYGTLVDVVVMRFPDTKRSRGFGFITFSTAAEAEACFENRPHMIDNQECDTKWATPREEMGSGDGKRGGGGGGGGASAEAMRKIFVGGLNYSTTDEGMKEYFERFGEIKDCVVMKFRDTKRSRGFGFVTFTEASVVDDIQTQRPHTIDGSKVETKRATPKEESGGRGTDSSVKKVFIGGLKDECTDELMKEYFEQFGTVINVEQMTVKGTGKKRGFGFAEFTDYDAVDKMLMKGNHVIAGCRVDVKRAVSKGDMKDGGGGGGGGGSFGGPRGGGGGGGMRAPWGGGGGGQGGFGGGYSGGQGGGGFGGGGGYGGGAGGGMGYGGGYGAAAGGAGGGANPWGGGGGGGASWEDQGNSWGGGAAAAGGNAWGGGSWGAAAAGGGAGGGYGAGAGGGAGGGMGGPMRNNWGGGQARSQPYNVGGGNRGGGGYGQQGAGGGGRGRW